MIKGFSGIIYMYKSPSGKYYIGQTIRPKFRKNEHVSRAFNGSELPFHRAIRKYGMDSFEYSILCKITCSNTETLSEDTKNKIRDSHVGKICNKRPCCQYTLDGEFISEYSSIKEAAEMNNINKVSISLVLSGKHKTAGGYTWKYKEDNNNDAL